MTTCRKIREKRATKCRSSSARKTITKFRKNSFAKKCVATCEKIRARNTRIAKRNNLSKTCATPTKRVCKSNKKSKTPAVRNRLATKSKKSCNSRNRSITPAKRLCKSRKRACAPTKRVSNSRRSTSTMARRSCKSRKRTTSTRILCKSRKRAFALTKRVCNSRRSKSTMSKRSCKSRKRTTSTTKRINKKSSAKLSSNNRKCVKRNSSKRNKSNIRKCRNKKITKAKNKSGFEEIKGIGPKFIEKLSILNIRTLKNLQGRAECTTKRIFKRWLKKELCASPVQIRGIIDLMTFFNSAVPKKTDIVMTEESAPNVEKLSKVPELCKENGNEQENKMKQETEQTNKGGFFSGIFGNKQVTIEPMEVDEEIKKEVDDAKKEEVKA